MEGRQHGNRVLGKRLTQKVKFAPLRLYLTLIHTDCLWSLGVAVTAQTDKSFRKD